MATEIRVPTLGESVSEATIGKWTKKAGDAVKKDEVLVELETDKVSLEVVSPADVVQSEIKAPDGETVTPGAVLGVVTEGAAAAPLAAAVELCLFDGEAETRHPMTRAHEAWTLELPGDLTGTRYGYRAHGAYEPHHNLWLDPAKLLVDPYALELDRRFVQHPRLAQPADHRWRRGL